MKIREGAIVLAAAIVLLAGAFALGRVSTAKSGVRGELGPDSQRSAALASERPRAAPMTTREFALELQVQGLERRLAQLENGSGNAASSASSEPRSAASEPRAALNPEEYEAARQAALQASEQRFSAASGMSDWGTQRELSYRAYRPKTGHVQSATCRAAVCRLEVLHDRAEDAERFVDETEADPRFANVSIRWFFANREKTRRILFIEPLAPDRKRTSD